MRTFIQYDENGEIIAVLQTESLPEGVEQPFYLEDEKHGAAEVTDDAALKGHAAAELGEGFKFDAAKRKLVKKSASESAEEKAAAKKATAKKGKRSSGTK
jgi:hypothetical protein